MNQYESLFDGAKFEGLKRLALLKKIEAETRVIFESHEFLAEHRNILGASQSTLTVQRVISQSWSGIEDFSAEFFLMLKASSARQDLTRQFIISALKLFGIHTGFSLFEVALISNVARIASLYDRYYIAWIAAVQGNDTAKRLNADIDAGLDIPDSLTNSYTIIEWDETSKLYTDTPYSIYFGHLISDIVEAIDNTVVALEAVNDHHGDADAFIAYFKQYSVALAETDPSQLENSNRELDILWMNIKGSIQVVHDIETGYGDPLRCKAIPDFSLRFVDDEYENANATIQKIQTVMVDYFSKRNTDLSRKGLFALENSSAAVYYLPFCTANSLHFRFSGQSIPNRPEVKDTKGVKIFFDPVSTASRIDQTRNLIDKVAPSKVDYLFSTINTIDTIIYHVAAHEVGHAIYGLGHIGHVISVPTKSLMEEPRAELTAVHTLRLLIEASMITLREATQHLISFAMQDLRRFAMYNVVGLRPYVISAINYYKLYDELGFIKVEGDELCVDESKAEVVLEKATAIFEQVLDAEDKDDGETIETMLRNFEDDSSPIIQWLVTKLFDMRS